MSRKHKFQNPISAYFNVLEGSISPIMIVRKTYSLFNDTSKMLDASGADAAVAVF
ncbi:hypothetical protein M4I21_17090 [Cellulophaga sp. 20_2_10]|uniref:hypothetical protein n=1 Tax=Cellulophaga sp. 20_2_10 TaxID=2942476 RepID=UPI00201AE1D6|nr:hypothetical protein [Cellulophaga sp. 20_2_10]MCL5247540.1 hypothetical protein [Cellulophaga sp. 20_2_10]